MTLKPNVDPEIELVEGHLRPRPGKAGTRLYWLKVERVNRRITALTLQKRNRQRVNVYLDGEFAFGLARIVAAWLEVGMELSEDKIAQLQSEDEREATYQRALHWLNYQPRTSSELQQRLARWEASAETTAYVIDRLTRSGLVNDAGFAQNWVENRSEHRPRSRRALAYELRQRGINPETIQEAIQTVDEEELAYQASQRYSRKLHTSNWKEFRQKMLRHLAQRGFSYDICAEAVRRVWVEQEDVAVRTSGKGVNHDN